ncbi:hypothetical protein Ciccas_012273, partial [Cichlidogyrus casuarinus]
MLDVLGVPVGDATFDSSKEDPEGAEAVADSSWECSASIDEVSSDPTSDSILSGLEAEESEDVAEKAVLRGLGIRQEVR